MFVQIPIWSIKNLWTLIVTFCPYNLPCLQWCALHASAKTLLPTHCQEGIEAVAMEGWTCRYFNYFSMGHQVMPLQRDLSMPSCAAVVAFSLIQIVFCQSKIASSLVSKWVSIRMIVSACDGTESDTRVEGLRQLEVWHPFQYLPYWQNMMSNLPTNRYLTVKPDAWEHIHHALEMLPSQECHYTT